jgi:2'-5' RNA ligase
MAVQVSREPTARLFFALWPDDEVRAALARLAASLHAECGGRAMLANNIHLTLAFLGDVAVGRIPELRALAAAITAPEFDLTIDTLSHRRRNRIVWAGAAQCPEALRGLAADLARNLRAAGFRSEDREHVPHITLLRDARRGPVAESGASIRWHVDHFTLVQSNHRDGATVYEVIARWRLTAA